MGDNYKFRAGVKKYFRIATLTGNHKVSFLLFEDKNYNGELSEVRQPYDELNTDVTGVLVYARNEEGLIQTAVVNQNKGV